MPLPAPPKNDPPTPEDQPEVGRLSGPVVLRGLIVAALIAIFLSDLFISDTAINITSLYVVVIVFSVLLWDLSWVTGVTVVSMLLNLIGMRKHQIESPGATHIPINHLLVLVCAQVATGILSYQMIVSQRRFERAQRMALARQRDLYERERAAREALQKAREEAERQALALSDTLQRERQARQHVAQARSEREKTRQLAETFQRALLPSIPKSAARGQLVLGELYQPAIQEMQMGGDFYDVILLPDACVGLVIGDIAGHGVEAAARTAIAGTTLRAYAVENPMKPAEVVERVNRTLTEQSPVPWFVSLVYGVYDPRTRTLTYANAGHEPPILLRGCEPAAELSPTGMVAGVQADATYQETQLAMQPGDCLVFLTDGLTEARNGSGGELLQWEGTARLAQKHCQGYHQALLCGEEQAAYAMAEAIYSDVLRFANPDGEAEGEASGLNDDMALLVVYVTDK